MAKSLLTALSTPGEENPDTCSKVDAPFLSHIILLRTPYVLRFRGVWRYYEKKDPCKILSVLKRFPLASWKVTHKGKLP